MKPGNSSMQPDTLRTLSLLEHMRDAAQYIPAKTVDDSFETYRQDRDLRQIVERNLEAIGEALNRLRRHDPAVANRISEGREIIALRNVLIHAYDDIDPLRIWQVVEQGVPVLLAEVGGIMDALVSEMKNLDIP